MMYKFMELNDKTEINYSDIQLRNGQESTKVYIEKPVEGGFHSATCYLPSYDWEEINGFSHKEIENLKDIVESTAHIILKYSKLGGLDNAANI